VSSLEPTAEQLAAISSLPAGEPVVMINLLAFKASGGAESYGRYAQAVVPHLQRVGGEALYAGAANLQVVGEGERPWWDTIIVVRYPSPEAFLAMVADADYQAIHLHRAEGLERAELIATSPGGI
jgi:uncharacterized protein (DUF1330 family)